MFCPHVKNTLSQKVKIGKDKCGSYKEAFNVNEVRSPPGQFYSNLGRQAVPETAKTKVSGDCLAKELAQTTV